MSSKYTKLLAGAAFFALLPAGQAWALGTEAGTPVNNTFTLQYRINGAGNSVTLPNPGDGSHEANFVVDRVVDVSVAAPTPDAATVTAGGTVSQVFTIINEGNSPQAYSLTTHNLGSNDFDVDATNATFEVSYDNGATYVPYTLGTATNDVAPSTGATDGRILLRVTTTGPSGSTNGDDALYAVVADTLEPAASTYGTPGSPTVASTGANTDDGVQTVLRDDIGDVGGTAGPDANQDGNHSDTATVTVQSATISAIKDVALIEEFSADEATCAASSASPVPTSSAIFRPGSCVEYTISVTNTGAANATDVIISDILDEDLTFVSADASDLGGSFTGSTNTTTPATNASIPTQGDDCDTDGCNVTMIDGTVPSGTTTGLVLRIRARVK